MNTGSDTNSQIPSSWVPVTPVRPILPKPPSICADGQQNQHRKTNWFLPERFSDGFAPGTQAQRIVSEAALRSNSQLLPGGARICSDFMELDRLRNVPFASLIALADASVSNSANGAAAFGSNPWGDGNLASGRNSIPTRATYDLNSPPVDEEDQFPSMVHPFLFTPLTPGPPTIAEDFQSDLRNSSVNERTEKQGNEVGTAIVELEELQHGKEHRQQLEDPSNAHKELQENHNPGVDLNQTPPHKPRRKKHRPKVVIEGQQKPPKLRTPIPHEKTPTVKRKYVRKSTTEKTMGITTVEVTRESNDQNTTLRETRSCRRKLNYEFETTSNIQLGQVIKEKTQLGVSYDTSSSLGKEFEEFVLNSERQVPASQKPVKTDLLHELRGCIQDEATRGKCRIVFSDETHDKQGSNTQIMIKMDNLSAPRSPNDSNYSRSTSLTMGENALGSKRAHSCTNDKVEVSHTDTVEGYSTSLHQFSSMFPPCLFENNGNRSMYFPAIYKKKRTEKVYSTSSSSTYSTETAANMSARQSRPWLMNNASVALYTPGANCRYSTNQFNTSTASTTGPLIDDQRKQQLFYFGERMTKKRSKGSTRPRNMTSQTRMLEFRQFPTFQSGGASTGLHIQRYKFSHQYGACMEALVADHHATLTTKKRTKRSFSARSANTVAIWSQTPSIDEIVEKLRRTDINSQSNRVAYSEKGALVPYNFRYERANALVVYQRDGTLVPFGGSFNPLKKRKPRPKVEIDEETDRVWKLLLENINSEGIDGTDAEKAKWWEDERSVFQGRADSFIARMHLVQGDRRFSPWKGSVLDSVVGVFLTQNVSDHLSSSAFMALAARFPPKTKSKNSQCSEERSTLSKELEACILNNDDSNKLHEEKSSQSTCSGSPVMIHEAAYIVEKESVDSNESHRSSSSGGNGPDMHAKSTENREEASSAGDNKEMDGVFSCQHEVSLRNTLEPSMAQTAERARSWLQDDPEEDKITSSPRSIYRSSFVQLLQKAETLHARKLPTFEENANTDMGGTEYDALEKDNVGSANPKVFSSLCIPCSNYPMQETSNPMVQGIEQFNVLAEESSSSEISKKNEENCNSEQSGETAESVSQAESRKIVTTISRESPKSSSEISHACSSPDGKVKENTLSHNWPMWNSEANTPSETRDHSCVMQQVLQAPNLSTETLDITASSVIDDPKSTGNKEVESGLEDYEYLPGKEIDGKNTNRAQLKTGRMKKKKHNPIKWDSLRLQAQSEGKTRERTENTMDSLDWEAVRHADVNEIAYTIRERGMNNMLAERIKDFLNRLVREHGSTDLEWLRDVPPDKAKEYLLSIRGLGLKSVECVRLLTLHHLAFPVDTNVGRIAVRLGWVPLQPLPESLQLHLLELYPVLESIQRYLWPRLCKLDQRTLYELHYQMITFGKVFCTKSKPNCNACPMRGECRHFASAFASARLSLPGPEEKGIVSASQTKASNHTPVDIMKPLQLTSVQPDGQLQGQQQMKMSEPVIEIPSTPEPIVEVPATPEPEEPNILECDIEDAFYEDPDEIPTIKLNIEQFAQNLQNYMQHNMELQEGEMSRALVSLTPDAASIPMPKLKNVNRLRTEHHVYELPDSHPLLEGLDKREPDDPCFYLLAIWTPGEMADSIQPPDRKCNSQDNGTLCDEPTCFSCNSIREANNQTVRGTLLIPCRTAMRGSFPLNGTYFQVNEVFADHESSVTPIDVPRAWLWNLPRRTVYFGTSIPTIFKGFSTESIQYCFWRGFVCVRGFDQKTRAPRPLMARLHFPASKLPRTKGQTAENRE